MTAQTANPEVAMYLRQIGEIPEAEALRSLRVQYGFTARRCCRRYGFTARSFNAAVQRESERFYQGAAAEGRIQAAAALTLAAGCVAAHMEASDPTLED